MSEHSVPQLRVTSPADLAQLLPYLVGFNPEESLVVAVLQDNRVQVTARVDVDDLQHAGAAEHVLDRLWGTFPGATAVVAAYTDQEAGWKLVDRCENHLGPGVVRQAIVVDQDQWHTVDGRSGRVDASGPLAAEATYYGLQRRNRRADLEATFASAPDSAQLEEAITSAIADLEGKVATTMNQMHSPNDTEAIISVTSELIRRNLPGDQEDVSGQVQRMVGQQDAIQLAALVQVPDAQNVALLSMTGDNAPQHLQMWRDVVNQTPSQAAETPLFLAGMAGWICGDGATATVALERAQKIPGPPGRRPSDMLDDIIDKVVPPTEWATLRPELLAACSAQVQQAATGTCPPAQAWETIAGPPAPSRPAPPVNPPASPGVAI